MLASRLAQSTNFRYCSIVCLAAGGMPFVDGTLVVFLQRPSGPPDHHRGLHYHRIRGSGPLLLNLSLLSSFQLALEHLSQDVLAPISGNL